jgi:uncharacterized protein YbjT (DUF2867 family)
VLTRPQSQHRVAAPATAVVGDALDPDSYARAARSTDTIVHLVGTPHPSPAKAADFGRIDLPSIHAAVAAASRAGSAHLIYVSVAHPAPVMHAYVEVRSAGERLIESAGLTATILRPWYVLGPGHWWPLALMPMYAVASRLPSLREGAERLGLVTLRQMVDALVASVEQPPPHATRRLVTVPEIRRGADAIAVPA